LRNGVLSNTARMRICSRPDSGRIVRGKCRFPVVGVPPVRFSSELNVFCSYSLGFRNLPAQAGLLHPTSLEIFSLPGLNYPFFRANPFTYVTDIICRIPLYTLFYRPEDAILGDLMRLLVRTGEQIIISPGFSLTVMDAPDSPKSELLFLV